MAPLPIFMAAHSSLLLMLLLFFHLMTIFFSSMAQAISSPELFMDRHGCGETKGCLFKPAGCSEFLIEWMRETSDLIFPIADPMLDCSIGWLAHGIERDFYKLPIPAIMFYVSGRNKLTIQVQCQFLQNCTEIYF